MKSVALKTTNINGAETTYKALIVSCLQNPPQGGADSEVMRKRIRVGDALEKATETLELEDADAETLKGVVADMRWTLAADKNLLAFLDDIKAV